jgi:two-component system, chemotaxis family, CheB/CheR fusion protein
MNEQGPNFEKNAVPKPKGKVPGDLIVVGIGASAGGLEALTELLQHLPTQPNMAFVVIQHLDPRHDSSLPELLSGKTGMRVVPVQRDVPLEPTHLYVISPNTVLRVQGGRLVMETRPPDTFKPIDIFFHSVAEEFKESAIGIVLSGTATDGTFGLKHIKAEGGITFAQDQTAKFDSMPRSAIAAGAVDFVLSPRQIAQELVTITLRPERLEGKASPGPEDGPALDRLLVLLRRHTGVDFKQYKQPTISRRLTRRMIVRKSGSLEGYFRLLQKEREELDALFDDLLINVTEFFREPNVFDAARRLAFPVILQNRKQPHTLRAWIPGCSSGEEVYSLAITLTEFLESQDLGCAIQMFGTDVSEKAIELARKGIYNESAVLKVSPERLRRFFVRMDSGYQVARSIREMCIFSPHNVAKDPPLSRMDIISCRNLLIYFTHSLQRKVIRTFTYALQPNGCLILGPSETVGSLAEHFTVLDQSCKLYCRKATRAPEFFEMLDERSEAPLVQPIRPAQPEPGGLRRIGGSIQRYADQIVLSRYGPAGVVVDESLRITSYRGEISEYLRTREIESGVDLMSAVRADLRAVLSTAIEQARRTDAVVVAESPAATEAERTHPIAITVIPLSLAGNPKHYLVLLGRTGEAIATESLAHQAPEEPSRGAETSVEEENANLKQELTSTREYLQAVIEELRSTNEEVQSANEELQSTNEEMQTSKEELQSSNEELHTINEELQNRNAELAQVNDDLVNLLGSMNMPIIMTGRDLRIRRFTPIAEKALRLIPTDVGRPIADLKPRINVPDLEDVLRQVLDSLQPYEREVVDHEGRSYLMRVRPYRTSDDRIDGTVLQLVDVSEIKRSLEKVKYARDYAEAIVNTIHEPLAVLDEQLMIRDANRAFYDATEMPGHLAKGKTIFDISSGRFDTPPMRTLIDQVKRGRTKVTDVEIEAKSREGEVRTLVINAQRLRSPDQEPLLLMALRDVTERKRAAEARYRRLFESAGDGIVIVDALSGDILDVNPFAELLLGYQRQDLAGRKLWEIESIRNGPNMRDAVEQIRERGILRFDQIEVRAKDNRDVPVEVIGTLYWEGERQAIQLNMRDVGDRKKFEFELQETQKLESLGLLAGGIAHDFNNLLTGILGNASLALSDTSADQPMRLRLRQIVDAAERAAFLTRQMLAYAGRGRFLIAHIDLGDLVREISQLIRTSIPKAVDLKLDTAPNLPAIEADPAQLQQLVMNLVINGAEAIGENQVGAVTVRTSLREVSAGEAGTLFKSQPAGPGTYVQLEVIDTGVGMDEDTRTRVFDPFFTTKFMGRGLGLAAVQGIVRAHRGAILVQSAPGRGATFRIFLPASRGPATRSQTHEEKSSAIPGGSVALIIDDEDLVRKISQDVLSRQGMRVLTADNGKSAVEVYREHGQIISVIVLDLQMPVMGGEETLALLREIDPEVPIILSSGFDEIEATRRFAVRKPAGFLQKPYSAQRLVSVISAALNRPQEGR